MYGKNDELCGLSCCLYSKQQKTSEVEAEKNRYIVSKSTGSWYEVLDMDSGDFISARLRGAIRLKESRTTNPIAVGDNVSVQLIGDEYVITEILPRRNYIIRRSSNLSKESHIIASNIDMLYIVATEKSPRCSSEFIDRLLITSELYSIPATILVNKCDIESDGYLTDIYRKTPYEIRRISAREGFGIPQLREEISGRTVLFTGNSGVGKSTIVNSIDPALKTRVGDVSQSTNRGRHTTTYAELYPFNGGYMIDSPGIKGFGLIDVRGEDAWRSMPDIMKYADDCQFHNCTHTHEPGCAVVNAVEEGRIHYKRYESYLKILEDDNSKYRR